MGYLPRLVFKNIVPQVKKDYRTSQTPFLPIPSLPVEPPSNSNHPSASPEPHSISYHLTNSTSELHLLLTITLLPLTSSFHLFTTLLILLPLTLSLCLLPPQQQKAAAAAQIEWGRIFPTGGSCSCSSSRIKGSSSPTGGKARATGTPIYLRDIIAQMMKKRRMCLIT